MNKLLACLFLVSVLGCDFPKAYTEQEVRYIYRSCLITPEGKVYKEWTLKSDEHVEIKIDGNGREYLSGFYENTVSPHGWKLELKYVGSEDLGAKKRLIKTYESRRY